MMKLRILLLSLLVVYTIHFMAQESYSNDVTCVKADDNIAVITASGTAEKKKDVYNMALKSIFNAIFLNGIDGVNAKVDLDKKTAYVELSKDVSDDELTKAVTDAGYEVVSVK